VSILAQDGEQPLALAAPGLLACTFHPELTGDPWFHQRFLGRSAGAAG
jgi:glutamine amidotransferase PdxT